MAPDEANFFGPPHDQPVKNATEMRGRPGRRRALPLSVLFVGMMLAAASDEGEDEGEASPCIAPGQRFVQERLTFRRPEELLGPCTDTRWQERECECVADPVHPTGVSVGSCGEWALAPFELEPPTSSGFLYAPDCVEFALPDSDDYCSAVGPVHIGRILFREAQPLGACAPQAQTLDCTCVELPMDQRADYHDNVEGPYVLEHCGEWQLAPGELPGSMMYPAIIEGCTAGCGLVPDGGVHYADTRTRYAVVNGTCHPQRQARGRRCHGIEDAPTLSNFTAYSVTGWCLLDNATGVVDCDVPEAELYGLRECVFDPGLPEEARLAIYISGGVAGLMLVLIVMTLVITPERASVLVALVDRVKALFGRGADATPPPAPALAAPTTLAPPPPVGTMRSTMPLHPAMRSVRTTAGPNTAATGREGASRGSG